MKRVFLDTNILMDAIEFRKHGAEANMLLDLSRAHYIQTCAAVISFATLAYLLRHYNKERIHQVFENLTDAIEILPMNDKQFFESMSFGPVRDFEDMLQYQCAKANNCDLIITNNGKDYAEFCDLPFMTAAEFLNSLKD